MRGLARVGRVADGAHHGHAVGPGGHHLGNVAGVNATNGDQRQVCLAAGPGQARQPQRRSSVWLGGRGKHGADSKVVHRLLQSIDQLIDVVYRPPQPHMRRQQAPGVAGRQVALAQVQAIGFYGQRHVQPVVDDQRHVVAAQQRLERLALAHQVARAGVFAAQLHTAHAAQHCLFYLLQPLGFIHVVAVGDPIQAQLSAQRFSVHGCF